MTRIEINKLSNIIIGVALNVHKNIGSGFAEKIYQKILEIECKKAGLKVEREKKISVEWDEKVVGYHFIDFLISDEIIVETKVSSELNQLHKAQLLSYLKVMDKRLGLLLNFGSGILDIKRVVNNF